MKVLWINVTKPLKLLQIVFFEKCYYGNCQTYKSREWWHSSKKLDIKHFWNVFVCFILILEIIHAHFRKFGKHTKALEKTKHYPCKHSVATMKLGLSSWGKKWNELTASRRQAFGILAVATAGQASTHFPANGWAGQGRGEVLKPGHFCLTQDSPDRQEYLFTVLLLGSVNLSAFHHNIV